jgi:hypothetical protein
MNYGVIDRLVDGVEQIVFHYEVPVGQQVSSISTGNILDGDSDGHYTVFVKFVRGGTTNDAAVYMYFNEDSTASNYGYRGMYTNGSSLVNLTATSALIRCANCSSAFRSSFNVTNLYLRSGYAKLATGISANSCLGTNTNAMESIGGVWNNTSEKVRKINFRTYSSTPNDGVFLEGSSITIIKHNTFSIGTKVGEIRTPEIRGSFVRVGSVVLGEASNNVIFPNLNGNRDYIYYIRTLVKGTGAATSPLMRINNDTNANYGYTRFYTSGTTAGSSKTTTAAWMTFCTGISSTSSYYNYGEGFLFAKAGVERCGLGTCNYNAAGTIIDTRYTYAATWNNLTDNIHTISFPTHTSNYAAGSTFEIYALRPNG